MPLRSPRVMPASHHQGLDLVEDGRVGEIGVVAAEHLARADDPHLGGVLVLEHVADLGRRGVGAQHEALGPRHVEGVLHVAGGMARRHVEGLEAVVVVLDLAALVHLVAHAHEDVLELLAHGGEGVPPPEGGGAAGQGDVDALALEVTGPLAGQEVARHGLDLRFEVGLERVQHLPGVAPRLVRQLAQGLEQVRHRSRLAAEKGVAQGLQVRGIADLGEPPREVLAEGLDARVEIVGRAAHEPGCVAGPRPFRGPDAALLCRGARRWPWRSPPWPTPRAS